MGVHRKSKKLEMMGPHSLRMGMAVAKNRPVFHMGYDAKFSHYRSNILGVHRHVSRKNWVQWSPFRIGCKTGCNVALPLGWGIAVPSPSPFYTWTAHPFGTCNVT